MTEIENDPSDTLFLERMNVLIERCGGPGELARKAGLSRRVIDKYRRGESDPSRSRLVAMAMAANVSVEWLATGQESAVDPALTPPSKAEGTVDQAVLAGLLEVALALPPTDGRPDSQARACLIATFYAELVMTYADPNERLIGMKLQSERLRRILEDGAPAARGQERSPRLR